MSHRSLSLLAAAAAFTVFGGLHFEIASGRALDRLAPDDARIHAGTTIAGTSINRAAKSDRGEIARSSGEGRTITFQHPGLPSTTVALRLWETAGAAKKRPALNDKSSPSNKQKHAIACEGVVSALTDVARQLEAGRCVT